MLVASCDSEAQLSKTECVQRIKLLRTEVSSIRIGSQIQLATHAHIRRHASNTEDNSRIGPSFRGIHERSAASRRRPSFFFAPVHVDVSLAALHVKLISMSFDSRSDYADVPSPRDLRRRKRHRWHLVPFTAAAVSLSELLW